MNLLTLAQYQQHVYGFEGTIAQTIFIVGFVALMIVVAYLVRMSLRNWVLAAMVFATCLSPSVSYDLTSYNPTWLLGLTSRHAELHLALGSLLTLFMFGRGGFSIRTFSVQGVILLIMAFYAGLLMFIHEPDPKDAFQALGFAAATIPCVIAAAGQSSQTFEGCVKLLKMLMLVAVAWAFCCSVQFVLNPQYLLNYGGRFVGMLANAQHAAVLVSIMAVVAMWLLLHEPHKLTRVFWATLVAINLLFLIWTASRTGALMFVVGLTALLYSRVGKMITLLPVAALIIWGLAALADALQIGANLERFTSTTDTRGWVWAALINNAMESPLIGVGWSEAGGSESSYLMGFASYGILYFLFMLALLGFSMLQCFRLTMQRKWLPPEHRPMVDVFVAFCAMYFAGAVFEGFILARSFVPQLLLLIFSAIGAWLTHEIAANQAEGRYAEAHETDYDESPHSTLAAE
jgi:hypothetical protein